jgi:hypothetical protein
LGDRVAGLELRLQQLEAELRSIAVVRHAVSADAAGSAAADGTLVTDENAAPIAHDLRDRSAGRRGHTASTRSA